MAENKDVIITQLGFTGGVNLRDAPDELSQAEASAVLNMVYHERGAAVARNGCSPLSSFGSSGDRILSMHRFDRAIGGPQLIVHTTGGQLLWSGDLINWNTIVTGLSTTEPYCYVSFNGKVYMSNGVDDYRSWNGAATAVIAVAPKFKYLVLWKDTMIGGFPPNEPTKIRTSAPGDAENWPVNNFNHVHKDDGDPITGLGQNGLTALIFKRDKAFIMYDIDHLFVRLVDHVKGCESHFSIINHENNVYYISKLGVARWLDNAPAAIMSWRIDPLFDASKLNFDRLDMAYGYVTGHRVGWSLPEVGQLYPTFQVELYPNLPEFPISIHRAPVSTFATWRKEGVDTVVGGSNKANKLYEVGAGSLDDGVVYPSFIQTGWHDFGLPNNNKYLRYLRVLGKGRFTTEIKTNFYEDIRKSMEFTAPETTNKWDVTDTWDVIEDRWGIGASNPQWQPFHPDTYGHQFCFRFNGNIAGSNVRQIDVGGVPYLEGMGQWGIYHAVLHGIGMGDRVPIRA